MSGDGPQRPWWASPGPGAVDGDDLDPVERHRRARAGGEGGTPTPADAPDEELPAWWAPAAEAVVRFSEDLAASAAANADTARGRAAWDDAPEGDADRHDAGREHADPPGAATDGDHRIDACGICPICVGLRALGASRPELVGHLSEAARHLAAAVRAVVDTTSEAARGDAGTGTDHAGLTRIDLDDDGGEA